MTTNRCIHAAAAAPYERYMTTNRSIHAAAAHPKHVAFVFQGTTQMCSIVRRSKLTPYVKMGRATTFFLAQWQTSSQCHPGRGFESRRSPSFFLFFFLGILVSYCFLNFWFAGRCASSAIALIPSVSWCVRLLLRWWPRESEGESHAPPAHTLVLLSLSVCVCVPLHGLSPSPHPTKHTHNVPIVYIACAPMHARWCSLLHDTHRCRPAWLHGRSTVTVSVLFLLH
ncbi:hypothetical protein Tc00.1047053510275.255 [Trypanosoma cruzi]|uniref:Uncharacterized protein n=1 Tax=Trypanosoma cruzi (strain CL Brener) TaxID=353153 RepID=Q4E286_TRYCC|nr:hypothetical protein Tc00.1047053510275.255 [Trypanosoma cruzi]EAN98896.1 hypothetical protein Tc00.1047053510275.255 [Trypanosoma cruzi]|eukprot:XP_820747.1 hypothetical protein [Trypanosoma cruzi strain CL Brener]